MYGVPDKYHPLYVCTVAEAGFGTDINSFIRFREMVESKFHKVGISPVVLFLST